MLARKQKIKILFGLLSIVLILVTWYLLKEQGITMTETDEFVETVDGIEVQYKTVLVCENKEENHIHTDECYDLVQENDFNLEVESENNEDDVFENNEDPVDSYENDELENVIENEAQNLDIENSIEEIEKEPVEEINEILQLENDILMESVENEVLVQEAIPMNEFNVSLMSTNSEEISDEEDKVNVYVNIDDSWECIGNIDRLYKSSIFSSRSYYYITSSELNSLITKSNNSNVYQIPTSGYSVYYKYIDNNYNKTTLSSSNYSFGNINNKTDVFLVSSSVTSSNLSEENLNQTNKLKIYSIIEYDSDGITQIGDIQYSKYVNR